MNQSILVRLQEILEEASPHAMPHTVGDICSDFRNLMLPKFKGNSGQYNRFTNILLLLEDEFGDCLADSFGPVKLTHIRQHFIDAGNCRRYVNEQTRNVIRIFRFAVSREKLSATRLTALKSLDPLKYGEAPEGKKREVVELDQIRETLPFLSMQVATMLRIQLATAMRPSEIFGIKPRLIDRTGRHWIFRPERHKSSRHGTSKAIPILGDARAALTPYLLRGDDELCFTTQKGNKWRSGAYRWEVHKACDRCGIPRWRVYSVRHLAARTVREKLGVESAKSLLGHASSIITEQHYAAISEAESIRAAEVTPRLTAT